MRPIEKRGGGLTKKQRQKKLYNMKWERPQRSHRSVGFVNKRLATADRRGVDFFFGVFLAFLLLLWRLIGHGGGPNNGEFIRMGFDDDDFIGSDSFVSSTRYRIAGVVSLFHFGVTAVIFLTNRLNRSLSVIFIDSLVDLSIFFFFDLRFLYVSWGCWDLLRFFDGTWCSFW